MIIYLVNFFINTTSIIKANNSDTALNIFYNYILVVETCEKNGQIPVGKTEERNYPLCNRVYFRDIVLLD